MKISGTRIFIHINKTAGTSLRQTLVENFSKDEIAFIYPHNAGNGFLTIEQFAALPEQYKQGLAVVYGHFSFGIHKLIGGDCRYVAFVRNPVDRVLSAFYHHKYNSGAQLYSLINDNGFGLNDFLEHGYLAVDNFMTRRLSGANVGIGEVTETHLNQAIDNINNYFDFLLLTEKYSEGVNVLLNYYELKNFKEYKENVNFQRPNAIAQDRKIIGKIVELNVYDKRLYSYVRDNYLKINRINKQPLY